MHPRYRRPQRTVRIYRRSHLISSNTVHSAFRTVSRKNFTNVQSFIAEPDSRAQCQALEENVKEFGLTYFGMTDRRQGEMSTHSNVVHVFTYGYTGIVHIIGPDEGFTVRIYGPITSHSRY